MLIQISIKLFYIFNSLCLDYGIKLIALGERTGFVQDEWSNIIRLINARAPYLSIVVSGYSAFILTTFFFIWYWSSISYSSLHFGEIRENSIHPVQVGKRVKDDSLPFYRTASSDLSFRNSTE